VEEHIISAAIKIKGETGENCIVSLPKPARHHHIIHFLDKNKIYDGSRIYPYMQGFLTSEGRFADRNVAYRIAHHSGQLKEPKIFPPELFSEDLW
jgi:hypothetical protein